MHYNTIYVIIGKIPMSNKYEIISEHYDKEVAYYHARHGEKTQDFENVTVQEIYDTKQDRIDIINSYNGDI